MFGVCLFMQPNLYLLIIVFRPFIFNVLFDMFILNYTILFSVSLCSISSLFLFLPAFQLNTFL